MKNKATVKRLSVDLHNALQQVPLDTGYHEKLSLYGKILQEEYNWCRVDVYTTHEQLDDLENGSRIITSNNNLAVKHSSGWVILTTQGYSITHLASSELSLPANSIPVAVSTSPGDSTLDDSHSNGTQVT